MNIRIARHIKEELACAVDKDAVYQLQACDGLLEFSILKLW